MDSIRLIVCFDLDADTPGEAYAHLESRLNPLGIAWETSDEWYDADGEQGDPDVLQAAIVEHFQSRGKSPSLRDKITRVLSENTSRCCDDDNDRAALVEALVRGLEG